MAFRDTKSKIIIKTPEQIEGIKKSSIVAAQTLKAVIPFVKPGVSTGFLNKVCTDFIRDHKAIPATLGYHGYTKETCISVNDVICHGIPGSYELREGDIVNVDVTTILNGYFGDTSTMFAIGEISEHAKKLIRVTKECLAIGIRQSIAGNYLGNIGYEINKYATSFGYSVVYEFCGHGVGLKFHEEPEVSHVADKNSGPKLAPGMIFTIEPMINAGKARSKVDKKDGWTARTIDGKLSAQFEHTICVTKEKPLVLTDIDHEFEIPKEIF
ncbi:MAG: type I methionyl aminopeptidase [Bacteroidota bacterium]|nr:type I methionyl aminopeptidase [Bacteroidota bacterium]